MAYSPSPVEMSRILALLGRGGGALQKDLRPQLDKAQRDALVAAGFLSVEKRTRGAIHVELTDKAWTWVGENLTAPAFFTGPAGAVLADWLACLSRYMGSRDVPLSEILRAAPPAEAGLAPAPAALAFADVRAAALALADGRTNARVRLKDLRRALVGFSRDTLDGVLRDAIRDGQIVLYPLDDPRERTAEDEAASLSLGGMPAHILYVK